MSVCQISNHQSSKCPTIMSVVRCIILQTLKHNILIRSRHLSGVTNVFCDLLSRGHNAEFKPDVKGCQRTREVLYSIPPIVWSI